MDIFLVTAPGLEHLLADEAREAGLTVAGTIPGGVTLTGDWPDVWRANLTLRGATRVLARLAEFRAMHLAQLDKRARKLPWGEWLRRDVPLRVEAACRKSRIYHHRAAAQRIEGALRDAGFTLAEDAPLSLRLRIEDDMATISLDTSGPSLHKRGLKEQVNKAPMRETLAALFLRDCGYTGSEPVYDPMCGSGTFVLEAADIALGLLPGRARGFAFQDLAGFDADAFAAMKAVPARETDLRFHGSDRDQGAIAMAKANATRAGVASVCDFRMLPVSDIARPEGPPGLVIVNPPYGARIGGKTPLFGLYAALGAALKDRFGGWRVGLVTSQPQLAHATGLPFRAPGPFVDHGGIKIRLWQTGALPGG
ncbi:MAG: class I SAM-dependent RNA methyltransferase [Rhodobacteraceae bacterium]|nr:MAG: class I SAM-dependent RNA methyltransferase [Paracoccaceae bacterium]